MACEDRRIGQRGGAGLYPVLAGGDVWSSFHLLPGGGDYVVAGRAVSYTNGIVEGLLARTDASLKTDGFRETFAGLGYSRFGSIDLAKDGGYILFGGTSSFASALESNSLGLWLVKTDKNGVLTWDRTFGAGGAGAGGYTSALQTKDGGYVATGQIENYPYETDVWLIKTDPDAELP